MSEYTPNLNLFKYNTSTDGKEIFSIEQALNYNWDILDTMDPLPDKTGKSGYILTNDGTDTLWGQTGVVHCVVEVFVDGTDWYRVYDDNWCEQGGYATVSSTAGEYTFNLLKTFTDTNYFITGQFASYYSSDFSSNRAIYPYTKSQFKILTRSTVGGKQSWFACGYIEVE